MSAEIEFQEAFREMNGCELVDARKVRSLDWFPGFCAFLLCGLDAIQIASESEVIFKLPDRHACDMTGAIKLAKMLVPAVKSIKTFSGDRPDTCYRRKEYGSWECV